MGCDMHINVEAFDDRIEEWIPIVLGHHANRNYWFFSRLANVRNSNGMNHIAGYRGLPEDVSTPVARVFECGEDEYHSESWCTLDEMKQAINDTGHCIKISFLHFYFYNFQIDEFYENFPKWASQIRFIFWFDN